MLGKQKKKTVRLGLILFFSIFLAACGRDISTVESALEGQWTMTDAFMNGEPLAVALQENAEWFGVEEEDVLTDENGEVVYDVHYYYEEGTMTIVDNEGETTQIPYEVLSTDEENNTLRIEYTMEEEDLSLVIQEDMTFTGEERESKTSQWHIVDVVVEPSNSSQQSELERELEQFGQELAIQVFQSIEFSFHFDYVSEEAPAELQAE